MPTSPRSLALTPALCSLLPVLLVLLAGTSASAAEAPTRTRVLIEGAASHEVRVETIRHDAAGARLQVAIPAVELQKADLGGEAFDALELPGGGHAGRAGEPALPTFTRLVAVPAGMTATARIAAREMVGLGTVRVAPAEALRDGKAAGPRRFDAATYAASSARTPSVSVGAPGRLHGVPVVPVTISPVAYDPATGRTEIARHVEVEVSFATDPAASDAPAPRVIAESFARILAEEVAGFRLDGEVAVGPGTYVMICPDNSTVLSIVEDLAQWRRRQGYVVEVVSTAQTGTTNTAIRNWLINRYQTADPPLEFVTLVGDASGTVMIPSFREGESGYNGEGDHQYTTLDGADVLADVHIGRLSVTSTSQLEDVVRKIVTYESAPDMSQTDWFTTAGLTGDPASSGYSTIWVNQFVKEQLLDLGYTQIDTIWGGNYVTQMMATINQGETLFTYRGYWHMSGMTENHILSLNNGYQLPFAVILTCDTGSFWTDTTCRSEAFLRAPSGGGIASIGTATIGTHTRYNNCMFLGINNGVLNSDEHRVGPALTRGKLNLYTNYWVNEPEHVRIWSTWNNLMGDPATEIFTGVPALIDVDHPAGVSLDANALPVTVTHAGAPVAGARVAVVQDGTVRSTAETDASGEALLDIAGAVAGQLLVTVTGTNTHPYLGQATVGAVGQSVDVTATQIADPTGNGDGLANCGETLDLSLELSNAGSSPVGGVTASLRGAPDWATLDVAGASYGSLPAGGSSWGQFQVTLGDDAPGGRDLTLRLDASGEGETWSSLVTVPVHGPWTSANRLVFGGPGGDLDPGESGTIALDLGNVGNLATAGVTAELSCTSKWIDVTDASGSWGAIAAGGAAAQADPFAISITDACYPGHLASLVVELTFAEGGTQTIAYPVVVGEAAPGDPTGPDAYGYYAFDDQDDGEYAPTYDWVDIAGVGQNIGIADDSRHDDETVGLDLPFPFTYYGQTHERVSVCSNGWLSFSDTYIKLYRNWSLPADGSPDAMICAFWDDLAGGEVYTHHDTANHRFIVQWDGFGSYYGGSYTGDCTFQIILHDPAHHATDTGDGLIVIQYQSVQINGDETTYFTVGLQDQTREVGLTYAYGNNYAGGAATVAAGRAIAIRPVVPQAQGTLLGSITNQDGGGSPVADAMVTVLGGGRQIASGADGRYSGGVPVGTWDVMVTHPSFAADTVYAVPILENEATMRDFALRDVGGPDILAVTQLADTEDTAGPYVVEAQLSDHTGLAARALHYTTSVDGSLHTVDLQLVDALTGTYRGTIPGQPEGTRVQYWLTAADVLGNTSASPAGAPWPTYGFMVASVVDVATDDCEQTGAWQVNVGGGDNASSGEWERGDPIGTFENGNPVQPEDDHTAAPGTDCWFTGQHVAGQSSGYNDVDGGTTSLYSPVYDLGAYNTVEVSYWRWYSNDEGYSPGEDTWAVDVSNDGGSSWTSLENTTASDESWQQISFVVNDLFAAPDRLRLRFRASDLGGGSLVEAAVDDLAISASEVVADLAAPTVAVTGPAAGGQYGNGQTLPVTWTASDDVGVVSVEVRLSLDGGATYDLVLGSGPLTGALDWTVDVPADQASYDARVRVQVIDGQQRSATAVSGPLTIVPGTTAAVLPTALALDQNHPNPFNPQTSIRYALPQAGPVRLQVFDLQGRLVRTLVRGEQAAGVHTVVWKGRDDAGSEVASGIYFYRLSTDAGDDVRKMTLLK
jgi:hypothetical protein